MELTALSPLALTDRTICEEGSVISLRALTRTSFFFKKNSGRLLFFLEDSRVTLASGKGQMPVLSPAGGFFEASLNSDLQLLLQVQQPCS